MNYLPILTTDLGVATSLSLPPLLGHDVAAIKESIAKNKSGGDYLSVGPKGEIGRYHIPLLILLEFEYLRMVDDDLVWSTDDWDGKDGFSSPLVFMNSHHTQEAVMNLYIEKIFTELVKRKCVTESTTDIEAGGLLIAAYFMGIDTTVLHFNRPTELPGYEDFVHYMRAGKQAITISNKY